MKQSKQSADAQKEQLAQHAYHKLIAMMDDRNYTYTPNEEKREVNITIHGNDTIMEFTFRINTDRQLVLLNAPMQFTVAKERRVEMASAIAIANFGMYNGCFDYRISSGEIYFRMAQSFTGSLLGHELFAYMLDSACSMIDTYSARFLMFSKGVIDLDKFIDME